MRISLAGHGLSVDLSGAAGDAAWAVASPWADPEVQRLHGIYLHHTTHPVQLHVRSYGREGVFDATALRALVAAQAWASPPRQLAMATAGSLVVAAATFSMVGSPWINREYFVTDGARLANLALPGPELAVQSALDDVDHLIGTLRFA